MGKCKKGGMRPAAETCVLLVALAMQMQGRQVHGDGQQRCKGDSSGCRPPSLLPVYEDVEAGSVVAVCVVSKESELPGKAPLLPACAIDYLAERRCAIKLRRWHDGLFGTWQA